MMRKGAAIVVGSIILGGVMYTLPLPVRAQAEPQCTPACASDLECTYLDNAHTQTGCTTIVDALVVTAPKKTPAAATGLAGIVNNIVSIANRTIIPLLYALAFVFFIIGVVRFFFIEGGEEGQQKGRKFLLYGMIGLVLLFALWGIVNLLLNTLTSVIGT